MHFRNDDGGRGDLIGSEAKEQGEESYYSFRLAD